MVVTLDFLTFPAFDISEKGKGTDSGDKIQFPCHSTVLSLICSLDSIIELPLEHPFYHDLNLLECHLEQHNETGMASSGAEGGWHEKGVITPSRF